jgi:transcriptional regulator with XRE-family HTH domain
MHTKNNINNLLLERGFKQVVPTDDTLEKLGMTIKRFNKIIGGKTELTLTEANSFAEWLGVTIEELSPAQSQNLPSKFGLKN